jgi:hypothetical protein
MDGWVGRHVGFPISISHLRLLTWLGEMLQSAQPKTWMAIEHVAGPVSEYG